MPELEDRLRALAAEVAWPGTPDLAPRVMRQLPSRRREARRLRVAIAVALLLLVPAAGAIAFPSARDDVLEWLGVQGATVTRSAELPPAEPLRLADLGRRVSARDAERLAGSPPARPRALGPPDQIRYDRATDTITHVHGDLLVSHTPGSLTRELVEKVVTTQRVRAVRVEGRPAVFIDGAPHYVLYVRTDGRIAESRGRLAGDALVFTRGGMLVRIEAPDLSLARAREIARSLR
jgi:hypothetical protein